MQKRINVITAIILVMAIIQAPYLYYYAVGFFKPFITISYALIGLAFTVLIFVCNIIYKKVLKNKLQKMGLGLTILIGTTSLIWGNKFIESLDWNLRLKIRNEIVAQVKSGKLKPDENNLNPICTLPKRYFPPISNSDNKIYICKEDAGITIEFYIDPGFLDTHSAFVYTDDPKKMHELEEDYSNKKLNNNWFKVSH